MEPIVKSWGKFEQGSTADEDYGWFSQWLHAADFTTSVRPDVYEWASEEGRDKSRALRLATQWHWLERAKEYDKWRSFQPICKVAPLFSHMAEIMHRICTEELRRMEHLQKETADIHTATMKHRDIIRMVEQLRKTEEYCISAIERREAAIASGAEQYDYTKLSVDQLRYLEDLNDLAKVTH